MCFFHIRWIQLDFKSLVGTVGTEITQSLEAKEPSSQTNKVEVMAEKEWRQSKQRWQLWELKGQESYWQHSVESKPIVVEVMVVAEHDERRYKRKRKRGQWRCLLSTLCALEIVPPVF